MSPRFSQKKLLSEAEIQAETRRVAAEVDAHYAFLRETGESLLLVGVLKGGVPFFADLARELDTPAEWDFVEVASYGHGLETSGEVRFLKQPTQDVAGRHVLVVDDVTDSALTAVFLVRWMMQQCAASVQLATCVDKTARRRLDFAPDFAAFRTADGYLFGYGMDLSGGCRGLRNIWLLEEEEEIY